MSSPIWFRYPDFDNLCRDDDYITIHRPDDEVLYDTCAERPDHNTKFVYVPYPSDEMLEMASAMGKACKCSLEDRLMPILKFNPSSVTCA